MAAPHTTGNRRLILVAVAAGALLVVLLAIVLVLGRNPGDTVLQGVTVEGRDLGGASRASLEQVVDEVAEARLAQPVVVVSQRGEVEGTREDAGQRVDAAATVDDAWSRGRGGFLGDLRDRLRARFGASIPVDLEVSVDEVRTRAWAADAAEQLSRSPRDGDVALVVDDPPEVEVVEPATGEVVDLEDLNDRLLAVLGDGGGALRLEAPAEVTEPEIVRADVDAVLPEARQAISAPVELLNPTEGADLVLTPSELAAVLVVDRDPEAPEGQRLELGADSQALEETLGAERLAAIETEPTEAAYVVEGDEVSIEGGEAGFAMDAEGVAEQVLELARSDGDRSAELPGEPDEPEFSREDAEALGITERISSFTTEYTCCPARVTNIRRMAELVDDTIIAAGDSFSLNGHVGPRTTEKGFVEGGVIEDGEFGEQVGGGVSQLATTFFNAAFFAGIQLDAFQPHSYYIERYPMGRESTIHFDAIDVAVTNDSPHAVLVQARATDTAVTVSFYSTPWAQVDAFTGEPYDVVEGEVRDGFTVDFGRTVSDPDAESRTEEWTHTYEPQDEDEDDGEGEGEGDDEGS